MSNQYDMRDVYVENDFFWSAFSQGLAYGDTSLDNSYGYINGSYVYSIFDTGSAGILLSSDYFSEMINKLYYDHIGSMNYVIQNGVVFSQCFTSAELPTLYFLFNELWIEVKGYDYMVDVSPGQDMSLC
jgi:hypothetical protein